MRRSLVLAGVAAVGLGGIMPAVAQAPQVTPEGAEIIRLGIKDWLADHLNDAEAGVTTTLQGPIAVTPQGDHYALTIPAMEIAIVPNHDDGGGTIAFGAITAQIKPTPEGWYDATWTLPTEVVATENDGDDRITVTIGGQRGTGVYAPALESFMSSDIAVTDIAINAEADGAVARIGEITVVSSSEQVQPDIYDGSVLFTLGRLSVTADGAEVASLDRLQVEALAEGANMPALVEFQAAIEQLEERYSPDAAGDMEEAFFQEVTALLQRLPVLFDGIHGEYRLEGLMVDAPEGRVELASTAFGFGLDGLGSGASSIHLLIGLDQLGIAPPPPYAEFIPSETLVDVTISGIPNAELMQTLTGFMQSSTTLGAEAAGEMAAGQLVQAILASNTAFQIDAIRAVTSTVSFDMTGRIEPNVMSPFMVTGNATIEIGGIEQAIAAAQGMPEGDQAIQALTMLQTLGAQATNASGQSVRRYEVVIGQNGDLLLNGVDLKPLLGGL